MCKEAAMPKPINKQQLLDEAQKKYEVLERQFASFTPEEMVRPGVIGTWSIKDTLAHLLEWQKMLMDWYEAGLRGETPVVPAEGYNWSQLPALNQAIYERCRDTALDDVRSQLDASHKHMLEVVASLSEEELFTPGRYAWIGINTLASYVDSCAGDHYRWALSGIRRGTKVWSGETPAAKPAHRVAVGKSKHVRAKAPKNAGGTALLIIDVQRELFEKTTPTYEAEKLSLIHISEPTRLGMISYAVFCLKKKKNKNEKITPRIYIKNKTNNTSIKYIK